MDFQVLRNANENSRENFDSQINKLKSTLASKEAEISTLHTELDQATTKLQSKGKHFHFTVSSLAKRTTFLFPT